jgi:5-methyltetrahydrofolate--homocysteine methyltransferase
VSPNEPADSSLKLYAIDKSEALYYLGYRGSLPEKTIRDKLDVLEKKLRDVITPRYIMKVTDIDNPLLVGDNINEFLANSQKVVFFCVTLGSAADRLIEYTGVKSVEDQLILDALANAAIEQVADLAQEKLARAYPTFTQTERYSPGYGDFPLELQPQILAYLDAPKRIGVTAGESLMMSPLKSVTAVVGLKS